MKILILSCDTGCGHNSAAAAIADELERRGIEHTVFDPLTLGGKKYRANSLILLYRNAA